MLTAKVTARTTATTMTTMAMATMARATGVMVRLFLAAPRANHAPRPDDEGRRARGSGRSHSSG